MRRRFITSLAAASILALAFSASTIGAPNHRTVQILDNCDPVSFNAFLGPGACVRGGGMSVDTFISKLSKGGAQSWRFSPEKLKVAEGGTITAVNRGGEFHTFTQVAEFGGGCIAELNGAVGADPVPECAAAPFIFFTTGVGSGDTRTVGPLATGTWKFMCLIHPWQRTTVTVE